MRFYGNIKFPIILSINCNLPRKKERKKRLNSSREGRRVYDIRTREKRETGKVKRARRRRERGGGGGAGRERRDERSKFLSARNRIREWFMGLHRGRIHRGPPGIFLYSYALSLVFFAPPASSSSSPPPQPRHGGPRRVRGI